MDKKIREYTEECVEIIKDVIINNELVNGAFINYIGANKSADTIIIRDILNHEIQYELSEISYVFTDYLDCIGEGNKNIYNTVLKAKDSICNVKYKDSFMKSLNRLKEIEKSV